jgi:hypothetical protein
MSLNIPTAFTFDIEGIPQDYSIAITEIPRIDIALEKIDIEFERIDIALEPIEIKPMDFSIRLKEIPSIRAHLPLNYQVCLALFGFELVKLRLCGEGQLITEPYVPNPCECDYSLQARTTAPLVAQPATAV